MLAVASLAVFTHVPSYSGGGIENCFQPVHHHSVSQAVYLRGSGGLEVHLESDTEPFDTINGELIDFDAVFKEQYDTSTYSLVVGCGGCVATQDPVVVEAFPLGEYEPKVVEPFTQTSYASIIPKAMRKFNSSALSAANCDQKHFTVRLIDFGNRTDGKPIVWSAVIGLRESFTALEILSFPIYILRNHGDQWTDANWTIFLVSFLLAPFTIWLTRTIMKARGWTDVVELEIELKSVEDSDESVVHVMAFGRELLYELATYAFTVAILEGLLHLLFYAQPGATLDYALLTGVIVVLASNLLPMWQVLESWRSLKYDPASCSASPLWAPVETLTGVAYFFLAGAGYFVGPAAITLAGILRWVETWRSGYRSVGYFGPPRSRIVAGAYAFESEAAAAPQLFFKS